MLLELIITQTQCWIKSVVIEYNFCPFVKRELERDSIRYAVSDTRKLEACLQKVMDECDYLDSHAEVETTLIIFTEMLQSFDDYLGAVELAERLLVKQGYKGIYQIASFHPDYCFADAKQDDAANYTNRSPYPMLHILREASVAKALAAYPQADKIPQQNVQFAREKGLTAMRSKLESCLNE